MTEEPPRRVNAIARFINDLHLGRWPLLTIGLTMLCLGVYLADPADPSDARAFVFAVGALLCGAGVVLVAWSHHDPTRRDPTRRRWTDDVDDVPSDPTELDDGTRTRSDEAR